MIIEVYTAHGGSRYWRRLLEEWQQAGHTIREVSQFDDVTYRRSRGPLGRLWLRLLIYVFFPIKVWFRLRFERRTTDTVRVVITSPFYLPFVVAWPRGFRRRPPTVVVLNDLFPDALVHAGMLDPGGSVVRALGAMTRYYLKSPEAVVFLGEHLKAYAEQSYGKAQISRVIPVGADATFVCRTLPTVSSPTGSLQILYSGTMGHMHEIDTLVEVFEHGLPANIFFKFHSSGVGYSRFRQAMTRVAGDTTNRISLRGPLSDQAWRETLITHPIGLVTLKDGAQYVSMPSKTYSALAAGQAILAICALESDLAELIQKHDCGWVVPPGRSDELESLLIRIAGQPEEVHAKRQYAFRVGHSIYDMLAISREYLGLFELLLDGSRKQPLLDRTINRNGEYQR